jgi:hypothetical protein
MEGRKWRVTLVFDSEKINLPDAAMKANHVCNQAIEKNELRFVDGSIQPLEGGVLPRDGVRRRPAPSAAESGGD